MVSLEQRRQNWLNMVTGWRPTLLRLAIVVGVLAAAAGMGALLAWKPYSANLQLFALAGSVGAVVIIIGVNRFGQPEYGLLAVLLLGGLFNFFSLPTGTESKLVLSLVMAAGLCGLWFLDMLLVEKRFRLKPSPVNKPILTFIAVGIISFFWSFLMEDPLVYRYGSFTIVQIATLFVNSLLPFMIIYVINKIQDIKWLKQMTWILLGIGVFAWFSSEFNLPTIRMVENGMRGVFITWVGSLAYGQALFNEKLTPGKRGALLLLLGMWVFWALIQHRIWLSGWVPLGVACLVLTLARSRQLFFVMGFIGLLYVGINYQYFYEEVVVANLDEGGGERLEIWRLNLQHVVDHPLFGMGPAGYALYNMTYHPQDARSTHNNYFDILAQSGVIGLACFIWMIATFFRLGNHLRRQLTGQRNFEEAFANAVLAGLVGALVAMTLGDWVLPFAYNQTISGFDNAVFTWVFIGGLMALYHIVESQTESFS
ncbi:MAG: O-antigen ligase family protein [Chloroflexi bacterium]|nr:O-antigen ligase family protein [Chloroflexota bacterium]